MLPPQIIIPTIQRVDDVLEDIDSVQWELSLIASHPDLLAHLTVEAQQKAARAQAALNQVHALLLEVLVPFAEEQSLLKAEREAVLEMSCEPCLVAR
jgi:hypothetical protein